MTDLEITRLCAIVMGLKNESDLSGTRLLVGNEIGGYNHYIYDPLHDDAQCFALVKKFPIQCIEAMWAYIRAFNPAMSVFDLNRAICECVAKMQAAKGTA